MDVLNYRQEAARAKLDGLKSFVSATPCSKCESLMRYSCDAGCINCSAAKTINRRIKAQTDKALHDKLKTYARESKAKARQSEEGRQAIYEANKRYIEKNRVKVNAYYSGRRAADPVFKMASLSRNILCKVLARQNKRKDATCVDIVGYTGQQLKDHIERQFTKGMSWDLVGPAIHIDHIVSVAEMMRGGETNPRVINALSNLRPMWAKENIQKSDKATHLL